LLSQQLLQAVRGHEESEVVTQPGFDVVLEGQILLTEFLIKGLSDSFAGGAAVPHLWKACEQFVARGPLFRAELSGSLDVKKGVLRDE
jgi:hypothetical protein